MTPAELHTHIQLLLDGELSADQFSALEAELLENPDALETYHSFVSLHCGLQRHGSLNAAVAKIPVVPIEKVIELQRQRNVRISLLAAAAVLLVSAVALWIKQLPAYPHTVADFRTAPGSTFTLSHSGDGDLPPSGKLSPGSRIVLEHGAAEFDLPHDVRAIIDAPATLTLVDARSVKLDRGRAFFEVKSPDGHGFTVRTPHQKIVDLGTAFGVYLPTDSEQTHLHVFNGKVRVDGLDAQEKGEVIRAPMSVALQGIRVVKELEPSSDRFRRQLPDRVESLFVEDFESGLLAGKGYAIHMDPTAIRDLADNRFAGISEDAPWRFSTAKELRIRNSSFESAEVSGGISVPHWQEMTGVKKGFNTYRKQPKPTEGKLHLSVTQDLELAQNLNVPIRAGTTYTLTLDIGCESQEFPARAVVRFFGSDMGHGTPLAEISVDPPKGEWLHNQTLSFTANSGTATGQTLGISLACRKGRITFDDLRIIETRPAASLETTAGIKPENSPDGGEDNTAPLVSNFEPVPDATNAPFDETPSIIFDKPVRFGTGRVFIRNLSDDVETELIVGSKSTSLRGNVLSILPRLGLKDGKSLTGGIPGWTCMGAVSRFNPDSDGQRYRLASLADDSKTHGVLSAMNGPVMASLGHRGQPGSIRHQLGPVEQGRTYTVSVGIGSRSHDAADNTPFAGYHIRLLCGSVELGGISGTRPPGPADSVTTVGFSWDSREYPSHLPPDAPLLLEISTNDAASSEGGYLDIDHVRVTSLVAGER